MGRRYVPSRDGLLLRLAGFSSSALSETFRTPSRLSLKLGRLVEPISCPLEATLIVMAMRVTAAGNRALALHGDEANYMATGVV